MLNRKDYGKQYYIKNKDKIKAYAKQYYIENKDKYVDYGKKRYRNNLEHFKQYYKEYYIKNKERSAIQSRQWRDNNPDRARENRKRWKKNNIEKVKIMRLAKYMKRYRRDIKFNLNDKIKKAIRELLKGNKNGRHWESLVGYTRDDLIKSLNRTMPKGYTWQDFLEGKLHIDHIIPKSVFNYSCPEHIDFKKCWALSNLRLLPARENEIKSDRLSKPFQPALKILILKEV